MQLKQTILEDTVTKTRIAFKPKVLPEQFENEKGLILCNKNAKKILVPTTHSYLKMYVEMYGISINELGYIYSLMMYITKDNVLAVGSVPLTASSYAKDNCVDVRNVQRMFSRLIKKKVLKKIKRNSVNCYMFNPIFGSYRNSVSYTTYHVFRCEVNEFLTGINQNFRLENIDKHYCLHKKDIEREIEVL